MNSFAKVTMILLALALLCQCSDNATKPVVLNHTPIFVEVPRQVVEEGYLLQFVIQASDSDGTTLTIAAISPPVGVTVTDSGNGHALFRWEPDLTQSGLYFLGFVASDGHLSDTLVMVIIVTQNLLAQDLWPMSVGNYWVYEIEDWYGLRTDSIQVVSSYESNGETHWRLSHSLFPIRNVRTEIVFHGDSIIIAPHRIAVPDTWSDRVETVPAGVFSSTYNCDFRSWTLEPWETFVFAEGAGLIRYEWFSGSPHYPSWYSARLLRYGVR